MVEYPSFEHFARDVFLCNSYFEIPFFEENKFVPNILADHASFIIDTFADAHCEYFRSIFIKHEFETVETDEDLFKFAIPRCLRLIDKDRYFYSMMLVGSFLKELVGFFREYRLCYRFHFTVYKCFAAVYERFFKTSFELEDGWNGLQEFVLVTIYDLGVSKEKRIISALNDSDELCLEVAMLIEEYDNCNVFNLNDYETFLLNDNDVKEIQKSLDYMGNEDPLNMIWPRIEEDFNKIYKALSNSKFKEILIEFKTRKNINNCSDSIHHNEETCIESFSRLLDIIAEKKEISCQTPACPDTIKAIEGCSICYTDTEMEISSGGSFEHLDSKNGRDSDGSEPNSDDLSDFKGCPESKYSHDLESGSDGENDLAAWFSKLSTHEENSLQITKDTLSIMEAYVPKIECEARARLGTKEFWEKMKLRLCPCCGIKCCQFSIQLSLKQVEMAFTG